MHGRCGLGEEKSLLLHRQVCREQRLGDVEPMAANVGRLAMGAVVRVVIPEQADGLVLVGSNVLALKVASLLQNLGKLLLVCCVVRLLELT